VANRVARQLHRLPSRMPALVTIKFETRDFLQLDHVEHSRGVDGYHVELARILASVNRKTKEREEK
jgi:hypothetical protein